MLIEFFKMFSHFFILKAFLVGMFISIATALLGTVLVLKRYSMIGDGLSHVSFSAYTIALALNFVPILFTLPVVLIAAFCLLWLSENNKIRGDAAVAIISNSFLSLGIVVVSATSGMNTNIWSVMFGSVLAISNFDLFLGIFFSLLVIIAFIFFYNKLFAITFDEKFAKVLGVKISFYNFLIAFLIAVIIVIGMKIMGALLMASLIVFPTLTSMRVCKNFKLVTLLSAIISFVGFFVGLVLSYLFSWPTGATIVLVNLCFFIIFSFIRISR